jgi:transposase
MNRESLESLDREALIQIILTLAESFAASTRQVEMLMARVAELEAKLDLPRKTPNNSSTPPSRGQKPSGEEKKPQQKRKAHSGAHRSLHPNPTTWRNVMSNACQHCATDVSATAQIACEAYDHIEIPETKPNVIRVTLHGGTCPCCNKPFKALAPADMPTGSPWGPNLRALVIHLRFTQGVALERLKTLLLDLYGLDISEGALVGILEVAQEKFTTQTSLIRARLLAGTALESDETSMRVGKKNWWFWVFHHGDSAILVADPSRAKRVVSEFLGEFRPDFWVSDRYGAQMGWAAKGHQVCLAHLIRDVQYVIDVGDKIFAPGLRHLLGRACRIGKRRDKLKDATLKTYESRLNTKLDALLRLKPTHEAGIKLQGVIKKVRQYMFVFVTNRAIPPTNNGSERTLRPCVTFRKITNGFRTEWGVKLYANIRSVIETARRRGIGALEAIRLTLAGKPLQPMAP